MKIFLTGATGFVGRALVPALLARGHQVLALSRQAARPSAATAGLQWLQGDATRPGTWGDRLAECDAAINLAGQPVIDRWTRSAKARISDSRIAVTRNLVEAIRASGRFVLGSASAAGIYGHAAERELAEDAPLGSDFLARVARQWELEARRAEEKGVRVLLFRFGVVLDRGGGAVSHWQSQAKRFAGGAAGAGRQWFSWIHREDLVRAVVFLLERQTARGVFNLCAPVPLRQIDVARSVGQVLQQPRLSPAPAFALRLVFGEAATLLTNSQRAVPSRLQEEGFAFHYPVFEEALRAIFSAAENGDQIP